MTTNQKGFSLIEGLLILFVIGLVGLAGWYVYDRTNRTDQSGNQQTSVGSTSEQKSSPKDSLGYEIAKYKTYSNDTHGIKFAYPDKWSVLEDFQSTTDFFTLQMDDETVPIAGTPSIFTLIITKLQLSAESRKNIHNDNAKGAGYTTKLESGTYFGVSGYKFTHEYPDNSQPDFYYFVLDTPDNPVEIELSMQSFDFAKDEKAIKLGLDILSKGTLHK